MIKTNGVHKWVGVVVDVNDPEKANRVKVRIFGLHSEKESDVSNDQLQWALVLMPATSAATTGIGTTPHGLKEGSVVVVEFLDGDEMQIPIVLGSVAGIQDGYNTLPDVFKTNVLPLQDRLNEPDTNRLTRGDITSTVIESKNNSVDTGVPTASGSTWSEPQSPYNAQYPNNMVIETLSGHVIEIDDTNGAERIHIYHKSGSFIEMHPDGKVVLKTVSDRFEIVSGSQYELVKQNYSITVTGSVDIKSDGDATVLVGGNLKATVSGNTDISTGGNMNLSAGGNMKLTASRIDLN